MLAIFRDAPILCDISKRLKYVFLERKIDEYTLRGEDYGEYGWGYIGGIQKYGKWFRSALHICIIIQRGRTGLERFSSSWVGKKGFLGIVRFPLSWHAEQSLFPFTIEQMDKGSTKIGTFWLHSLLMMNESLDQGCHFYHTLMSVNCICRTKS